MPSISEIRSSVLIEGKTRGVKEAAADLNKVAAAQDNVASKGAKTSRATLSVERAYARLQRSLDPVHRGQLQLEKVERTLLRAREQGLVSIERQNELMALANQRYMTQNAVVGQAVNANQLNAAQLTNLNHQIADIGVSLASGQSPFMVMAQQGAQISAIFGPGTGVLGAAKALGTGLISFVTNPLMLTTIGIAAAAGAAGFLFDAVTDGADDADKALEKHDKLIRELKDAYGEAADGLEDYARKSKVVLDVDVASNLQQARESLDKEVEEFLTGNTLLFGTRGGFAGGGRATSQFEAFREPIEQLRKEARAGTPDMKAFREEVSRIVQEAGNPSNLLQLRDDILALAEAAIDAGARLEQARAAQDLPSAYEQVVERLNEEIEAGRRSELQNRILKEQREANAEAGTKEAEQIAARVTLMYDEEKAREALLKSQREAERLQKQATREQERAQQKIDNIIDSLIFEHAQLQRTNEEQAVYNALKRAGIDENHEMAGSIEEWVRKTEELIRKQEQATELQSLGYDTARDAARQLFRELDTGIAVVDNLISRLGDLVLQALLLGEGPLAGLFSGGLFIPRVATGNPMILTPGPDFATPGGMSSVSRISGLSTIAGQSSSPSAAFRSPTPLRLSPAANSNSAAAAAPDVHVVVNEAPGGDKAEVSQNADGTIEVTMRRMVDGAIADSVANRGATGKAIEKRFGVNPVRGLPRRRR